MDGNLNVCTMKKITYLLTVIYVFLLSNCDDMETRKPFGKNDGEAPDIVKIDSYEKIPGGAKIKFIAPMDEDLMYIKVKYTLDNGETREARASLYSDILTVEGYGNTETKTVHISAVDRFENEGNSIAYSFDPGVSAYTIARENMTTEATFGGLLVSSINIGSQLLYVDTYTKNEEDEWYNAHTEYSNGYILYFPVRGFDANPREFRIVIRDTWGNTSVPYETTLTPLYEELLDLSKFKSLTLPNDVRINTAFGTIESLFNGNNRWNEFNMAHSHDFTEFPVWFTFDMGTVAKLSRFVSWQRLDGEGNFLYDSGSPKTWEIWGRADTPNASGSWDGWIYLMECESIKPSGWPFGSVSTEDKEYARKGEEFIFPTDIPAVRYIRFKALSTHSTQGLLVLQQLWFYGQPVE
jgi:hypothetical protein